VGETPYISFGALAVSIHTVTAFLYAGIPAAFLVDRCHGSPFSRLGICGGPALLIILALLVRKLTKFDPGYEPIQALAKIVTYAMFANVFLLGMEFFTAFYSNIPGHMHPFHYLYAGVEGHGKLVPLMWVSSIFALTSLALLVFPSIRKNEKIWPSPV